MKAYLKQALLLLKAYVKQVLPLLKAYAKQTLLLFLYHPVAYLGGMLISGIIGVILGAFVKIDLSVAFALYDPLLFTIAPLFIFLILLYRDGYKSDRFSPRFLALSALPTFIAQHVCIFFRYYGVMAVGSCQVVAYALMPRETGNSAWEMHLVMLGLQLLIYFPTFLSAYYCGYKRRQIEITQMVEEDESSN